MTTLTEVELSEAGACNDHPMQHDVREDDGVEVDHLERSDHGVVRRASNGLPMGNCTVSILGSVCPRASSNWRPRRCRHRGVGPAIIVWRGWQWP